MIQIPDDNESTRSVTLEEWARNAVRSEIAEGVRSMIVVRVERYDADTQQVDVKPLVKDFHRDEAGALVVASVPVIAHVPVCFLTAGGFTNTVPIVAGGDKATTGMLFFSDRSLDAWLAGSGQEVDPQIYARNNLADGVFVPGVLSFGAPMSPAPPTDHATAGSITGPRVHYRDDGICIGDESGANAIGLDGDRVDCGTLTLAVVAPGVLSGTYVDPFGVSTVVASRTPLPLKGKLKASATQAKAK